MSYKKMIMVDLYIINHNVELRIDIIGLKCS